MLAEGVNCTNKFYILIDNLDDRWVDISIRFRLIRSLIESLKSFRRIPNLKILVALRSDILERVVQETGDLTFQREKFEDYFVKLKWSKPQLKELVEKRISRLFKRQYSSAQEITLKDIFPNRVGEDDPLDYIIERTLMRPRDVIVFVNEYLQRAEGHFQVTAKQIREAEGEFSRISQALEHEWQSAFPTLPKLLDYVKAKKKAMIGFEELCQNDAVEALALSICRQRGADFDPLYPIANRLLNDTSDYAQEFVKRAVSVLYRVGAVGVKINTSERFLYSHIDVPVLATEGITAESRIRVHPMLHRSLGIDGSTP